MPTFGQAFENTQASEHNPLRVGYFVRVVDRRSARMNRGVWWEMTDRNGNFWLTNPQTNLPVED